MERPREISETIFAFQKMKNVAFCCYEGVLGLKNFSCVQEYLKIKTSKHQEKKQSSFNLAITSVTTFNSYRTRSLTAP